MSFWDEMIRNDLLMSAVSAWLVAQVLKTLIHLWINKKLVWERLVGSGGMPSSHSATVCALATSAGIRYGAGSAAFAISVIFAIIVMYDARGVRQETGKQAVAINEMLELFEKMNGEAPVEEKLKEFVGHTPLQVAAGAILGICMGAAYCLFPV
ncbi:MAG: divergent PAP2 family protein [Lachnospiraceae bacterium]|nr:divergent PAP2 family protein [Lachnospiraceae bacterium]